MFFKANACSNRLFLIVRAGKARRSYNLIHHGRSCGLVPHDEMLKKLHHRCFVEWSREKIALHLLTSERAEKAALFLGFHAFGSNQHTKRSAQSGNCPDKGLRLSLAHEILYE